MMVSKRKSSNKRVKAIRQIYCPADDGKFFIIPEEIMVEILTRLPVKSLLKFRCVCKSWLSLISSSQFIEAHLKTSTENPNFSSHRIMFNYWDHDVLQYCSLRSLLYEPLTVALEKSYHESSSFDGADLVGSCNGLVCFAVDRRDLILWNPATRISKKLPPVASNWKGGFRTSYGFGYNESDGDFKVVAILFRRSFMIPKGLNRYESMVVIYSLKTNSWKRIEDFKGDYPLDGKFASGKLHYLEDGLDMPVGRIISLDLESEMYGTVEQPDYGVGCCDTTLGVLGGCISILCSNKISQADIWVLKEYGIKESWTKVVYIPYWVCSWPSPLCMLPNGDILLVRGRDFLVCSMKDNSYRTFPTTNIKSFLGAEIYIESLVSSFTKKGRLRKQLR